jgi:hypothetical protein
VRALALAACLAALGGCDDDLYPAADMAAAADLSEAPDLSMPDLRGPSCGELVTCVLMCGLSNLECAGQCVQGVQPATLQRVGALALCAATNCLNNPDGGTVDFNTPASFIGLVICMSNECPDQVAACEGLPF